MAETSKRPPLTEEEKQQMLVQCSNRCSNCDRLWARNRGNDNLESSLREGLENYAKNKLSILSNSGRSIGDIVDIAKLEWSQMTLQEKKSWSKFSGFAPIVAEDKQRCSRCKSTIYCSKECQANDWKRHKKYCEKSVHDQMPDEYLVSPPLVLKVEYGDIPVVVVIRRDGFKKTGLQMYYSDHMGEIGLKSIAKLYSCEESPLDVAYNWNALHCNITEPCHDDSERNGLHCCDVSIYLEKQGHRAIVQMMIEAGLLMDMRKKTNAKSNLYRITNLNLWGPISTTKFKFPGKLRDDCLQNVALPEEVV